MPKFTLQALSAAAIAFSGVTLLYRDAQYAAVGPVSVATATLAKFVPAIAAVLYPILSAKWPKIASIASLVWSSFQLGDPETAKVLSSLSAVDAYVAARPDLESTIGDELATIRSEIVKGIK